MPESAKKRKELPKEEGGKIEPMSSSKKKKKKTKKHKEKERKIDKEIIQGEKGDTRVDDNLVGTDQASSPDVEGGSSEKDESAIVVAAANDDDNTNDDNNNDDGDDGTSLITKSTFKSLGVCDVICEACKLCEWTVATRIQKDVLPYALQGRDIIGLAETGSGKTGAFCIPLLQDLLLNPPQRGSVFGLILAPTRELAFQIHHVLEALAQSIGATSVCIVGGVDKTSQSIALGRNPHIIIATPGRLVDHLEHTKGFNLRKLRYLIMDEADRMLSLDFEEELNQILDVIPQSENGRKTMLFSATMTSKVHKLQRASLSNPVKIEVSTKFQTPKQLIQSYLFVPAKYKDCYLTWLIHEHSGHSILIFAATCNNVQRLAFMLRNLGFPAICLHGQMTQPKRLGALQKFTSKSRDIMICTDIASRGLDIPNVDVVINYDLPGHGKDYIHRVGRTARAGKSGKAIAMVTQYDVEVYQRLEALLGKKLPEYKLEEEMVLVLLERVNEAQRMATRELKEQLASRNFNNSNRRRRRNEDDDNEGGDGGEEGGMENMIQKQMKKGYYAGGSGGRGGALHNQRGGGKDAGGWKTKNKKHRK